MKQQHHPQDIKTYQKGINSDSNKEILGNSEEGEHVDALNMRSVSMDGDNYAKKKIKGEESLFPLIDNRCNCVSIHISFTYDGVDYEFDIPKTGTLNGKNYFTLSVPEFQEITISWQTLGNWYLYISTPFGIDTAAYSNLTDNKCPFFNNWGYLGGTIQVQNLITTYTNMSSFYTCMMAQEVNGHIVEIWASFITGEHPFMRIDGQIVLYSEDFPISVSYPLQYDKNENCVGGEIYVTNNNTPPMVFSIIDLMENSGMVNGFECTEKYFSSFVIDQYTIQVGAIFYKPAFIKQGVLSGTYDYIAGTAGLCVGSYSYSYRLVDPNGERTGFSPITELIPVVRNISNQTQPSYPYARTFSSVPDISAPTSYGNHIRVRCENNGGFSFLELRRDSWYAGDPIGNPPISEIIASVPINPGMSVLNIFDKAEAGFPGAEILDLQEQTNDYSSVRRAKSVRYFNERLYLMNIGYDSKTIDTSIEFVDDTINGRFSVIENMGKAGHKHVYNAAMYKSNMRGEKTGFGVVLFDKDNNASYATQIPTAENFEFPNRRDEIIENSDKYDVSYKGVVRAANTDGEVSWTHEVFDLENASKKVGQDDGGPPYMYNYTNEPAYGPYAAMNPTSQFDSQSDLNKTVNGYVSANNSSEDAVINDPAAFGLNYFSQGFAFKGLDSYPSWADGFSVVQTDPAYQVIAQGLGFYSLIPEGGTLDSTAKHKDEFWAYFPDLELLNPDAVDDIKNNPSSYYIQCVSPLGYFTEIYNSKNVREGADFITYARVLRDNINLSKQINPFISNESGILDDIIHDPSQENRYVAYGRYTNYTSGDSPAFTSNANGNQLFPLKPNGFVDVTTNSTRQTYFQVKIDDTATGSIYNEEDMYGFGPTFLDADDEGVMEWREPFYVINIVKLVDINPGLTTQYKYTGNYIKFKSLVLESTGIPNQSAILVSERWEDCIPQITGQVNGLTTYGILKRFVYVVGADEVEKRWMNITFESALDQATIIAGLNTAYPGPYSDPILTDGFDIYGIYTSVETPGDLDGVCRIFTLNFNAIVGSEDITVPAIGTKVYVKYDNRIPVKVFGGDTYINESTWAPIDNVYGPDGNSSGTPGGWIYPSNAFFMNAPFPMKRYIDAGSYPNWIETFPIPIMTNSYFEFSNPLPVPVPSTIRQIVTMWTAETRYNLSFAFNVETPDKAVSDQYFPLINYIPRPYIWFPGFESNPGAFAAANNMIPEYFSDYGYEWNLWGLGGIRFLMNENQTNIDYSKSQTTNVYSTIPAVGFEEQTEFCTRIIWSLKRPINAQNTPSVKTFPSMNYFDISDDTGEIKFAWSALSSDKGNNLYALTDSGVCLLLVDKRIIHEINANELATIGSDIGGILNQLWIDRTIGMHDETWRSWAEYSNVLFFCNGIAAYSFGDNQLNDISKTGFFELLNRRFNSLINPGYGSNLSGGFNVLTKEYVMNVSAPGEGPGQPAVFNTLIFGTQQASLQCQSTYNYDKYLYYKNHFFGMKNEGEYNGTFELGIGNQINGEDMLCYVSGLSDAVIIADKEFIRIRVNSNSKPEKIFFYKSFSDYKADIFDSVVDAVAIPLSIKNYFGYECYIPRSVVAPHYRNQGRVLIFKIVSTADEEFLVTSTAVQYKALK